jgi:acyl-coenzyme A synthetase/AMP-(fatty) acid ligase
MNVVDLLHSRAAASPDAPAIIDARRRGRRVLSFSDLERASARAAGLLRAAGLRPGDGVLLLLPMSAELYVALLAIFRLGLVALILDPSAGQGHIERCCALYPPQALIARDWTHLLRLFSPALRSIRLKVSVGLPVPGTVSWRRVDRASAIPTAHPCGPATPALLTFTSGSTGRPKAAVRSHGFLLAQHRAVQQALELKPGEVDITTLPVFVLANLASGVTSVIPDVDLRHPDSIRPGRLVGQVHAHRATRLVTSPALLEHLADYCEKRRLTLPSLRKVATGGGPVFARVWTKLDRVAPCAEVTAVYGSTEAEPIALLAPCGLDATDRQSMDRGRGLPAGFPVPSIRLRILHDQWGKPIGPFTEAEFAAVCLPSGEAGEIVVSGAHVLAGYLNGHGDKQNKFAVDGTPWHRTGDAGYLDTRGRLWLLGRCAARIDDAHGRLYPFGVESVALRHPHVCRAAFVGHHAQRILVLELRRSAPVPDLTGLAKDLAWAHLDEVQLHRHIPVDARHNAKVDHGALGARLSEQSGLSRLVTGRRIIRPIEKGSHAAAPPPGILWWDRSSVWATFAGWVAAMGVLNSSAARSIVSGWRRFRRLRRPEGGPA